MPTPPTVRTRQALLVPAVQDSQVLAAAIEVFVRFTPALLELINEVGAFAPDAPLRALITGLQADPQVGTAARTVVAYWDREGR